MPTVGTKADFEVILNDRWKVTLLIDPPQWVLNRKNGHSKGRDNYQGISYCQHKKTLIRDIREKVTHAHNYYGGNAINVPVLPSAVAMIEALPDSAALLCRDLGYVNAGTNSHHAENEVQDDQHQKDGGGDLDEAGRGIRYRYSVDHVHDKPVDDADDEKPYD